MDLVPSLRDGKTAWLAVRMHNSELSAYDGKGVDGFVDRFKAKLLEHPEEWHATTQAWLFFGTLSELFAINGIPFRKEDFVARSPEGSEILSTKRLPAYLAAWAVAATNHHRSILRQQKHFWITATNEVFKDAIEDTGNEALLRAKRSVEVVDLTIKCLEHVARSHNIVAIASWDLIVSLCGRMITAIRSLYNLSQELYFDDRLLSVRKAIRDLGVQASTRLFRLNSWCPREIAIIGDLVEHDPCTVLYCAQLRRNEDRADHSRCDATMCNAYQIDESIYQTKHWHNGCDCEFLGLREEKVSSLSTKLTKYISVPRSLQNIRMVVWRDGRAHDQSVPLIGVEAARLASKASKYLDLQTNVRCVAISHVWVDGMGNAKENLLPECQISRLQVLANKLFPSEFWPVPFWIDTLCLPIKDPEARRKAISQMERVYKTTTKILVIDSALTSVSTTGMGEMEIGMRIMCSGWSRRLWTLQEGAFTNRVHFQFKDCTHTYKEISGALKDRWNIPRINFDLPEDHHLKQLINMAHNERIQSRSYKVMNPVWPQIASFFKEMSIYHDMHQSKLTPDTTWRILTVLRTVRGRTTSKLADEALVISSLLHLTAGSAEKLARLPREERLKKLVEDQYCVPLDIIFSDSPRYAQYGAQWIPKSFLSQAAPRSHTLSTSEFFAFPTKDYNKEYEPELLGLAIFAPAIRVINPDLDLLTPRFRYNDYIVRVLEAGSDDPICDIIMEETILILPNSFCSGPPSQRFIAVVATIEALPTVPKAWPRDEYYDVQTKMAHVWVVRHRALAHFDVVVPEEVPHVDIAPLMQGAELNNKYCLQLR